MTLRFLLSQTRMGIPLSITYALEVPGCRQIGTQAEENGGCQMWETLCSPDTASPG